jgi:MoaA/NifB/PqqE/SkfB family radical SAM enzyme
MTRDDWLAVIGQAAGLGVPLVQFIGGEPTLHPDLPELISAAAAAGLRVEVFSNLVHVSPQLWRCFSGHPVTLATSWYSSDPDEHRAITGRPAHARTKANIAEAVRRGIPVRAGIVDLLDGQKTAEARRELAELGVTQVRIDWLRQLGRGDPGQAASGDAGQLCGQCGHSVAAVGPEGDVWPCVMARWLPIGNVRREPLAHLLARPLAAAREELFGAAQPTEACTPACNPSCSPSSICGPTCGPSYCGPR